MSETPYTDSIIEAEKIALIEALESGCIQLNDTFLKGFASDEIQELFKPLDITDRHSVLCGNIKKSWFNGTIPSVSDGIILNVSEIEVPADEIPKEERDNFTIIGDYGYYSIGYGLSIELDIEAIKADIKEL